MGDGEQNTRSAADDAVGELVAAQASAGSVDPAVESALRTASAWVGDEVWLVGAGVTDDGTPCVVVHASVRADLPAEVDGVPVRVVLDDEVLALDDDEAAAIEQEGDAGFGDDGHATVEDDGDGADEAHVTPATSTTRADDEPVD